jgi:hypothetical protein
LKPPRRNAGRKPASAPQRITVAVGPKVVPSEAPLGSAALLSSAAPLSYRAAKFSSLDVHDCHIANGEFRFYENGATSWECDISSTDSGDEWDGHFSGGLAGYDGKIGTMGLALFHVSPSFHFNISDKNVVKHWGQGSDGVNNVYATGSGPSDVMARLARVVFECNC